VNLVSGKIILLAAKNAGDAGDQIIKVVESVVPDLSLEVIHSVRALSNKLQQYMGEIEVAILLANTHSRLKDIIKLNKYLKNIRLILILPDRSEETISRGFILRPRYLSYIDSDFGELSAVLQKITIQDTFPDSDNMQHVGLA